MKKTINLFFFTAALKTQAQQKYQYSYEANENRVTNKVVPLQNQL